jgi:hypothetical protein
MKRSFGGFLNKIINHKHFFKIALSFLLLMHVIYLGKGALFFPDESRYLNSITVVDHIVRSSDQTLQKIAAIVFQENTPFYVNDRPGDVVVHLVPAFVQYFFYSFFDYPMNTPSSLWIPQLYNLLFVLLSAWSIFKIIKVELSDESWAQIAALLYLLSPYTFFYTRHTISYDISLGIFLYVLAEIFTAARSNTLVSFTKLMLLGCCNAFALSIYPGYIFFFLINASVIIWWFILRINYRRAVGLLVFFISIAFILLVYEKIAKLNNTSYIKCFFSVPIGIIQGTHEESFLFMIKHLWVMMGVSGVVLLLGFLMKFLLTIKSIYNDKPHLIHSRNTLGYIAICFAASWFLYAFNAYNGSFVFYGRLILMYIPILYIVFAGALIFVLERYNHIGKMVIVIIIVVSIVKTFSLFLINYPRDILAENVAISNNASYINDYKTNLSIAPFPFNPYLSIYHNNVVQGSYVIKNACYLLPDKLEEPLIYNLNGYKLIYKTDHPLCYTEYLMEGFGMLQREKLLKFSPKIEIYRSDNP